MEAPADSEALGPCGRNHDQPSERLGHMASETFVIESTLSPDAAFDRVIDLRRVGEWDRGIRTSRLVEGDAGSVERGTR